MIDPEFEGLLLLDKSPGPTSHDLVDRVRRAAGRPRVGHTGTLDPLASGLLILMLGRATRLARYLPHSPKTYIGSLELGWTSATDDVTGEVRLRHSGPLPDAERVVRAAGELEGSGHQVPPAFSARKVGGHRLYRLARKGVQVTPKASPVEVSRFELSGSDSPAAFRFTAVVSGGTYVRALVRDLGATLGCGAVLASLRRTRIGPFAVESALRLPEASETWPDESSRAAMISIDRIPLDARDTVLDAIHARRFAHGLAIPLVDSHLPAEMVRVLDSKETLLGIGECREGLCHPRVVLV